MPFLYHMHDWVIGVIETKKSSPTNSHFNLTANV